MVLVVPVNAMKDIGGLRGIHPLIINLRPMLGEGDWSAPRTGRFTLRYKAAGCH